MEILELQNENSARKARYLTSKFNNGQHMITTAGFVDSGDTATHSGVFTNQRITTMRR